MIFYVLIANNIRYLQPDFIIKIRDILQTKSSIATK